ncbi:hypothetical protein DPMN_187787 [Dreissena polymorpha]|uniref:Uncharacterized protein n=1 Tax=Dreissena polymorpha TaxID=45954 RepID=A0A9D4DPQ2_DREPO|nr:hypothetical protein DPMN_187787 [Dreissena polymorpha]
MISHPSSSASRVKTLSRTRRLALQYTSPSSLLALHVILPASSKRACLMVSVYASPSRRITNRRLDSYDVK